MKTLDEIYDLIDECDKNVNSGNVNSFASYDEGVRDALNWVIDDVGKPFIGREE